MTARSVRPTWALVWAALGAALLAAAGIIIAVMALSGSNRDEVALAIALIGIPAVLAVFAIGMIALVVARPSGAGWRVARRWMLALLGCVALGLGIASLAAGLGSAWLLTVAGGCALALLLLDFVRGTASDR